MFSFFNKRKREIERLNRVIISLELLKATVEMNLHKEVAKNALLEREKDDLINLVKSYEDQIKRLNLTLGDLNRTDNNSRYY